MEKEPRLTMNRCRCVERCHNRTEPPNPPTAILHVSLMNVLFLSVVELVGSCICMTSPSSLEKTGFRSITVPFDFNVHSNSPYARLR